MLVPIETLPGWPAAPNPTVLEALGVLVLIPGVLALVIIGAAYLSSSREIKRFGPAVNPARAYADPEAAALSSNVRSAELETSAGSDAGTGGTSARW